MTIPLPEIEPSLIEVTVPETVTFDASKTDTNDGQPLSASTFEWGLNGNPVGSGITQDITITRPIINDVSVTVTNADGFTNTGNATVSAFEPENEPPKAVATAEPVSGETPLDILFDGGQSSDPDGDTLEFNWDFSDGVTESGQTVTRTFTDDAPQSVVGTLTVTDVDGRSNTDSVTVSLDGGGGGGRFVGGVDDETVARGVMLGVGGLSWLVSE